MVTSASLPSVRRRSERRVLTRSQRPTSPPESRVTMSEEERPAMVTTGLLTQAEFDRIPAPWRAELEASARAFIERYGESWYRTERERVRSALSFIGVDLDEEPVGLFFHVGVPRPPAK